LDILNAAREQDPMTPVILMTAQASLQSAIQAVNSGAFYYIQKPFSNDELVAILRRACEFRQVRVENKQLKQEIRRRDKTAVARPIGKSKRFLEVLKLAEHVSPTESTVLIQGESGTGKEVLARAIHRLSARKDGPFIPVNCAAIPEGLLESELFGHERGAFTGAIRARPGRFELAREGTLFLDEIGDMPMAMQAKILRVLQEREFERVGGAKTITADVRVIAATHRDLDAAVQQGTFRQDLYYRLQGVGMYLPPLRERIDDLPLLITHVLNRAAQRLNRTPAIVSPDALRCLWTYGWPGNVRELQHVLEGAMVLSDGVIGPQHLPPAIQRATQAAPAAEPAAGPALTGSLDEALETWERRMILDALQRTHGVQARAARILGVSERSLWYRIKKLGIQVRTPDDDAPPA
ncbi:MAG TPA: sigma-54 dependent transcriptional regulator, partial [Methylomirabilota bacterium]